MLLVYHGSPNNNIRVLRDKSYVSIFPHVATKKLEKYGMMAT